MATVSRILDANANRAREALRVMEEAARFLLNNPNLSRQLKQLRHELVETLSHLPDLDFHRDTPGDVGTEIKVGHETASKSVPQVVEAAGKRLSEALRVIEEYAKTLGSPAPLISPKIESLRYLGYDLEQQLLAALRTRSTRQWHLCVLITQDLCPNRDWWAVVTAAVEPQPGFRGADCIQLREKSLEAGEMFHRAQRLIEFCRPRRVSVIINDRPDIALLAGADGVHLGQNDLPCRETRKLVGRQLLIGVSTTNLQQAQQAVHDGADYCGLGPMFPTTTKFKKTLAGPAYLRQFLDRFPATPHLAIGGITPDNLSPLVAAGARGVAVCSAVCAAPNPGAAVLGLLEKLGPPASQPVDDTRR